MEWLSEASFVFTSLKVGEYGLFLCFIASRGWFEVTGETENLLDGTFSRQQKVTLDSRLGPFDTLFYWATSAAFTCCPSVQKIFWNSYYTSLLSIPSRDVQNANRFELKSICSRLNTTVAIHRLQIWQMVITHTVLHSKITKTALKRPQITPEVPKSMHLGQISLLGLAKQFFFYVPPPPQAKETHPYFTFRSPFFVSQVKKKTFQWSQLGKINPKTLSE